MSEQTSQTSIREIARRISQRVSFVRNNAPTLNQGDHGEEQEERDGDNDSSREERISLAFRLAAIQKLENDDANSSDCRRGRQGGLSESTYQFLTVPTAQHIDDDQIQFTDLSDELVLFIVQFLGPGHFRYVAGINKLFYRIYKFVWEVQKMNSDDNKRKSGITAPVSNLATTGGQVDIVAFSERVSLSERFRMSRWKITYYTSIADSTSKSRLYLKEDSAPESFKLRKIATAAAIVGNLDVLDYAMTHAQQVDGIGQNLLRMEDMICTNAAKHGHLHIIQYARSQGCCWTKNVCRYAAENGHVDVLKWAYKNGCCWSEETCAGAALSGNLALLKWLRCCRDTTNDGQKQQQQSQEDEEESSPSDFLRVSLPSQPCPWDGRTCAFAAYNGNLECLKWARQNGCYWNEFTCGYAAQNGHFHLLEWARSQNCPWNAWTCCLAAGNGNFEIVKWARNNGCIWNAWTCSHAAKGGHLNIIKWARSNGCPWDADTIRLADRSGHTEIVQWARENGCPEPQQGRLGLMQG